MISTPSSSNPGPRIPVRRQPPLPTWRELPRRRPSDSKSRLEFKGNNLIYFEVSKNLSTLLSKCYHSYLRTKRNRKLKLLPRSPRVNERRERSYLLQILRVKSILILSHPNLHLKKWITQRIKAFIPRG